MKQILLLLVFCLLYISAQGQNSCTLAVQITSGTHIVAAINGTQIPTPICAANGTGNTTAGEWYMYIPTADHNVTITTDLPQNNGTDTRFHVYTGVCGSLSCFSGDDDGGTGLTSTASFNVTAGTTYRIAFDNRWSSAGFNFLLTEQAVVVTQPGLISFSNITLSIAGTKSCVVDMNGDYLDDVVGISANSVNVHYQVANSSGFTSVVIPTPQANFTPSWSVAAGDIDKNGRNDLLYGSGSGVTFMKQNSDGSGFVEMSGPQNVFSQRSNFIDINDDGNLDAFVCHDLAPNVYYINDGTGNLAYNEGGLGDFPSGGNYGSIWVDYDNDGDPDLFIAKCRGGNSGANIDELHRNDGNGNFTDVSIASGMAEPSQSWSSEWGDFDNDGDMDSLIGASSTTNGSHKLRRNNGDGTFTDVTDGSGYDTFASTNIEHVAHDFNNDGFIDVFGGGSKIMFNNGDMTFTPSVVSVSNGPVGDLNNDGFLDIQNSNEIHMNNGNANHWIKILLQGIASNGNGIGARVEIYGTWGIQIRDVRSGDGFRFMSSLNTHFGIGAATEIDQLVIRWPSGTIDIVNNPAIDEPIMIIEGSTLLAVSEFNSPDFMIWPNPASDYINIQSKNGDVITHVEIFNIAGKKVISENIIDQKVAINTLQSGTYFLLMKSSSGKLIPIKFIKN